MWKYLLVKAISKVRICFLYLLIVVNRILYSWILFFFLCEKSIKKNDIIVRPWIIIRNLYGPHVQVLSLAYASKYKTTLVSFYNYFWCYIVLLFTSFCFSNFHVISIFKYFYRKFFIFIKFINFQNEMYEYEYIWFFSIQLYKNWEINIRLFFSFNFVNWSF